MLTPINDEDWEKLLSVDRINNARKVADDKRKELSRADIAKLRRLCKTDRMFLGSILGYKNLVPRLHGHLSAWMTRNIAALYKLILMPRGHYKTTLCTIIDSVQTSLPDDFQDQIFPYNLGPEVRILLAHETHDVAKRFLYEITQHFTSNELLMALFPECVPDPREQRMNLSELELPRTSIWAEPTFDTMGVGGRNQGKHWNILDLDDIYGDKARDSDAESKATIQWFNNVPSFFVSLRTGVLKLIGTHYKLGDVYTHAQSVYGKEMLRYIRCAEEKTEDGSVQPIFPENFPSAKLARLKKDPVVWIQYSNNPKADFTKFQERWKRYYYWTAQNKELAYFPGINRPVVKYRISDLNVFILADPQVSRLPGVVVTAVSPTFQIFVLETYKQMTNPAQFVDLMFKWNLKWQPKVTSIEEVVFSEVYRHWLQREMQVRNHRFHIMPYKPPSNKNKAERVSGLGPYFAASNIYFHESQTDLIEEYDNFGATENYHILDALAQGPSVWTPAINKVMQDIRAQQERESRLSGIDIETGYSQIAYNQ